MLKQIKANRSLQIIIVVILAVISVAVVIVFIVSQGSRPPQSSTRDGMIDFVQSDGELTPGQDVAVSMDNVTVYVPAQANTAQGSLVLTAREPGFLPVANDKWAHIQAVNVEYRDAKGEMHSYFEFPSPVEICFQVSEDLWQTYEQQPDDLQVQYYAENDKVWEALTMVTHPENLQLCGQTDHLSLFSLALWQVDMVPVTSATEGPYEP